MSGSRASNGDVDKAAKADAKPIKRRRRHPSLLPKPPVGITVPWGRTPELRGYRAAEETAALRETRVWRERAVPIWEEYDNRNARRSSKLLYATEEGQALVFFWRAKGFQDVETTLDSLQRFDYGDVRSTLGFGRPRNSDTIASRMKRIDGVPSEATISRLRGRVPLAVRRDVWKSVYDELSAIELTLMEDEELLTPILDSSNIEIIQTCPILGEVGEDGIKAITNADRVTCSEGGQLPKSYTGERGMKATILWSGNGAPIKGVVASITAADSTLVPRLLREIDALLKERLARLPLMGVLTADSAFHDAANDNRRAIRALGYVDNIAKTSAYNEVEVAAQNIREMPFRDHPNWKTNGHRELACVCKKGRGASIHRVFERGKNGEVVLRVWGECLIHGTFSVTSGEYVESGGEWVKYDPLLKMANGRSHKYSADLRVGNGFTLNYWLAKEFGQKRWGHNEGLHGALSNRGQLLDGGNSFTSLAAAEIAFYQVMSALHLRGIEHRRRTSGR